MNPLPCRSHCGVCCIAPSISSALPGMPDGKPAGVACVNLSSDFRCTIWGKTNFPEVCRQFSPQTWVCGSSRDEAVNLINALENATRPG